VGKALVEYDPDALRAMASRMYQQAAWWEHYGRVVGVALGMVGGMGLAPLYLLAFVDQLNEAGATLAILAMTALGAASGYVLGEVLGPLVALRLRFQAQAGLCQVEQERHLRAASD